MSNVFESEDAAEKYDPTRSLPEETLTPLMDTLREMVPVDSVTGILDLGGGTGRFVACLRDTFGCPVVVVDPSEAMLDQGRGRGMDGVRWLSSPAESIPLDNASVDLVSSHPDSLLIRVRENVCQSW